MKITHTLAATIATMMLAAACSAPAPSSLDRPEPGPGSSSGNGGSSSGSSGEPGGGSSSGASGGSSGSSGSSGTTTPAAKATLEGVFNGKTIKALDTVAYTEPSELTVKVTDYAGACGVEQQDAHKKNGTYVKLNVKGILAGVPKIAAGKYLVAAENATTPVAAISAKSFDPACVESGVKATAGEITFTTVTETMVKGSFKATLGGKEVSGDFESPACAVPDGVPVGPCVD